MGSRVRNVMNELHGEKIDIVDYADDPASFVANALSPARVNRVHVVDLVAREAQVIVPDYQLSLAIGKEGQNARLAARLTGWRIDIRSDAPVPSGPQTSSVREATTVQDTVPETVQDTVPDTVPETVQDTAPETVPETVPEAADASDPSAPVSPGVGDVRTR
jgi:NusA-like KH domain